MIRLLFKEVFLLLWASMIGSILQHSFLQGYLFGWGFFFVFGPVFFTILYSTLSYGWRAGMAVVLGIASGDAFCLFLFYGVGLTDWVSDPAFTPYLGGIGGVALIILGVSFFRNTPKETAALKGFNTTNPWRLYWRGLIVNLANPVLWFAWAGFVAGAGNQFVNPQRALIFLVGLLTGIMSQDTVKVLFAQQIRKLLRPQWLGWIYRIIGLILIGSGVFLLFMVIQDPTLSTWRQQTHG